MSDWKSRASAKKKSVDELLPEEWKLPQDLLDKYDETSTESVLHIPNKYLSDLEIEITEIESIEKLLTAIASKVYSSVDVVTAFLHRAAIANQLTNCCTEYMFDYGLQRAKFLDDYLAKNGKPFGPLHGLPISLKDLFNVPGYDSTLGYVSFIGNKTNTKESDLVKLLHNLGAVFYVKTNIPQTLLIGESDNNIFGRCLNPNNLSWTAGGSSGGEGSLLKLRGSIAGIGTDVGGSGRIPALCCGIYGFKPTVGRFPAGNQTGAAEVNHLKFKSTSTPMATNVGDVKFLFKTIIDAKPWKFDHLALPITYQQPETKEKLTIGVIYDDETMPVHPTMQDIIISAALKLEKSGHKVVYVKQFPSFFESFKSACRQYTLPVVGLKTGVENVLESGEPFVPALLKFTPDPELFGTPPASIEDIHQDKAKQVQLTRDWHQVFHENNLDVLLMPGHRSTGSPHDTYGIVPFTAAWNFIDFPAIILPYGKVDKEYSEDSERYHEKLNVDGVYSSYKPGLDLGSQGHVQLVTPRLRDEELLDYSRIIDSTLNKY